MAITFSVTAAQMQVIDLRAQQEYGLSVLLLMENAGRAVAEAVRSLAGTPCRVAVLCGGGNNGGDGIVAARYLFGWGYPVQVYCVKDPELLQGDPGQHYQIAKRLGVPFVEFSSIPENDRVSHLQKCAIVVDALLGTGMHGDVREPFRSAVETINAAGRPVVAVDIPSGLDADRGTPLGAAVKATLTVTMAITKIGLLQPQAKPYVGRLVVADIGIPEFLLKPEPPAK